MNIVEVELLTDNLEETEKFYTECLGLGILDKQEESISFSIGKSTLVFRKSYNIKPIYHFAFNIPHNQLDEAISIISALVKIFSLILLTFSPCYLSILSTFYQCLYSTTNSLVCSICLISSAEVVFSVSSPSSIWS